MVHTDELSPMIETDAGNVPQKHFYKKSVSTSESLKTDLNLFCLLGHISTVIKILLILAANIYWMLAMCRALLWTLHFSYLIGPLLNTTSDILTIPSYR